MNNDPVPTPPVSPVTTPAPEPTPAPISTPPTPETSKKRQKRLLWGISALVLVAIVGITIFVFQQIPKANQAASTYTEAVRNHVNIIYSPDTTSKERAELVEKPVELQPIFAGGLVSDEYRKANDLEKRYDTLINETSKTLNELYTFLDMSTEKTSFPETLTALVLIPTPGFSVTTDKEDQRVASEGFIKGTEELATKYTALAERMQSYTFDKEIDGEKKTIIEGLNAMAAAKKEQAKIQREYNQRVANIGFDERDGEATLSANAKASDTFVKKYVEVRDATQALVKKYLATDIAKRLSTESKTVNDKYKNFVESLK